MSSLNIHRIAVLAALISMTAVPALAADDDAEKSNVPQVARGDIFGFTVSTDFGDKGARCASTELDGNSGKRDGRYHNFT